MADDAVLRRDEEQTQRGQDVRSGRPKEFVYFLLFGILPVSLLYLFASSVINDPRSRAFEEERRHVIAACMKVLDDRRACRTIIDAHVMSCFEKTATPEGVVKDRAWLARCSSGRSDGEFYDPH